MKSTAFLQAGFVVAWSSGFVGTRLGVPVAGALTLLVWRYFIQGALTAPLWRRTPRRTLQREALIGLATMGTFTAGVALGIEYGVSTGMVAVIASLQPVAAALTDRIVKSSRLGPLTWTGLCIAVGGAVVAVSAEITVSDTPLWAYLFPIMSVIGLVGGTALDQAPRAAPMPATARLGWHGAVSTPPLLLLAVLMGSFDVPAAATFWIAVAWLIAFSTAAGYGLYGCRCNASAPPALHCSSR